jgi:hypothetical protein
MVIILSGAEKLFGPRVAQYRKVGVLGKILAEDADGRLILTGPHMLADALGADARLDEAMSLKESVGDQCVMEVIFVRRVGVYPLRSETTHLCKEIRHQPLRCYLQRQKLNRLIRHVNG